MKTFLLSLLSRKFLIALSAMIICYTNKDWTGLIVVALGYLGINVVDAKLNSEK